MPNGMAAETREYVAGLSAAERAELVLAKNPYSNTGFTGVIKIKNKFQARLQVPGDGRGGSKKRKQCSLPGLFDTAEEAAVLLAAYKKALKDAGEGVSSPVKQDTEHKPRTKKQLCETNMNNYATRNPAIQTHAHTNKQARHNM